MPMPSGIAGTPVLTHDATGPHGSQPSSPRVIQSSPPPANASPLVRWPLRTSVTPTADVPAATATETSTNTGAPGAGGGSSSRAGPAAAAAPRTVGQTVLAATDRDRAGVAAAA